MNIISGLYKNRKIHVPKGMETRPTSSRLREALFNICQGYVEGTTFLDLFAGSGAMGLEALSRGAKSATFVDSSKESIQCIKNNIALLDVGKASNIFHADVFKALDMLARNKKNFDLIYADPPYDHITHTPQGLQTYSAQLIICLDNLITQNSSLLNSEGELFVEDSTASLKDIGNLQNLILKSSRQMGRSTLNHYIIRK